MAKLISLYDGGADASVHVIFVHGLGGDAYSTWTNKAGGFWPDWIAEDIPNGSVWTYSYAAPMLNWMGNALPYVTAAHAMLVVFENQDCLADGKPIVFICHSLGGLMVKQLLRHAHRDYNSRSSCKALIEATKGVLFAATPHSGSHHASLLIALDLIARPTKASRALDKNDPHLKDLNDWYRTWDLVFGAKAQIDHRVFYETKASPVGKIVPPDSADAGLPGDISVPIPDKDHINIVKPDGPHEIIHQSTLRFVRDILNGHNIPCGRGGASDEGEGVGNRFAIERHAELLAAIAEKRGIPPEHLKPLFDAVGRQVPEANFEQAVRTAIDELLAKAKYPVQALNDNDAVIAAIKAAREKLAQLDSEGAIADLDAEIAHQKATAKAAISGQVRLLREKADILAKSYQWNAAITAYEQAAELEPDYAWHNIYVGDIHVHQGRLKQAMASYEKAGNAAERNGDFRNISVSHNKIGDIKQQQGDLDGALRAYQAGLRTRKKLAEADASNTGWKRDLIVSFVKIASLGHEAIAHYEAALGIARALFENGWLAPVDHWMVDELERLLAEAQSAG